jgi:hypothetical protein
MVFLCFPFPPYTGCGVAGEKIDGELRGVGFAEEKGFEIVGNKLVAEATGSTDVDALLSAKVAYANTNEVTPTNP